MNQGLYSHKFKKPAEEVFSSLLALAGRWFSYLKKGEYWLLMMVVVGLFSPTGLQARELNPRFQHYTVEHGLVQNTVYCIHQDRKGFMWFGTEQGLDRFDGYKFLLHKYQYDDPNSLSHSYILSICEDASGILWIGTNGGGLNRYDPETERFTHYFVEPGNQDHPGNIINGIIEDHSRVLWIGTAAGIFQFHREKGSFTSFPVNSSAPTGVQPQRIKALCEDRSGTLWIGADEGLLRLDRERGQFIPHPQAIAGILSLYEDREQILWVGTDNGFYKGESGTRKGNGSGKREFLHYRVPGEEKNDAPANRIKSIYEDRFGVFWLGTDYGLHSFDRREKKFRSFLADRNLLYGLNDNNISAIYEDHSGALWVGVESGGLNKWNRTQQNFTLYPSHFNRPDQLGSRSIFSFFEDREGLLWVGTAGEGLVVFNRKTGAITNYRNHPLDPNSLSNNNIWDLWEDREGMVWIGTAGGGLNRFSRQTGKWSRYLHQPDNPDSLGNDYISSILEDERGNLWIGTNGGLDKLDPPRKRFVHYITNPKNPNTLIHNNIYVVYKDRGGILWLGTRGGLSRLDPQRETFTSYRLNPQNPNPQFQYEIFSLCEDRDGVLWIGTTGGLCKFDRETGVFCLYTQKDGLPDDVINGILEDEQGNLWLSTNKGISRYNPAAGKFNNYSTADGLQGYEFNGGAYYKSRRGEFFFGGQRGINAFFPGSIKDNPYIPPVVITGFQVFNRSVPIGKEFKGRVILEKSITAMDAITLSYKDYLFSFEFAALNYLHGENNEYAYMMEGIEKTWNYVGQRRFVTYANLAPGDYRFRVKASNNHGVWNEEGVSLKIKVTPPFWTRWWFGLALVSGVFFLGFGYYRVRAGLILRRNREWEDIVEKRTIALKESGEKYSTVVERAHHGIAIVQDNVVVFVNPPLAKLLGCEEKELMEVPLLRWVAPEKQAELEKVLKEFKITNKLSGNLETVLRHKDGQDIQVEIDYRNITYRRRPALLGFFQDLRMQKLLEEERMRTAKLESTRVLAGGIAHDFNNLLAVIVGNIELALADTVPGEERYRRLSDVYKASRKASDLVRQFITLSKGEMPILKKTFIQGLVLEVVEPLLQGTGVTVHFDLPPELWPVDCDAGQVKQALNNIVVNAQQAMPAGGILDITAQNEEMTTEQILNRRAGKYVCVSIKDNGCGIPQEDISKIFDPYFSTRKDFTRKGLGLGLTVVHAIISKHNGMIDVTSEVGVGTTVRIYLPASPTP